MQMTLPQWAVLPLIKPYDGDMRRNTSPYVLSGGVTMSDYSHAVWAKRELCNRGVNCYVDMVGV